MKLFNFKCNRCGGEHEVFVHNDETLEEVLKEEYAECLDYLERYDFKVFDATYFLDEKSIYIIVKTQKDQLSKTIIHTGPPIKKQKNSEEFLKKWENNSLVVKGPYKENDRWHVEIKREYQEIFPFLEDKIKFLSMGKNLHKTIKKNYAIFEIKDLLNEKLRLCWTIYIDNKKSWDR